RTARTTLCLAIATSVPAIARSNTRPNSFWATVDGITTAGPTDTFNELSTSFGVGRATASDTAATVLRLPLRFRLLAMTTSRGTLPNLAILSILARGTARAQRPDAS